MPNYTLNGLLLALCAVAILAVTYQSLEQFSSATVTVSAPEPKRSKPVIIRETPPAITAEPVTMTPLPKPTKAESPRTFYTIERATEYTANGVKSIPKGRRVNVLEAELGFVAISDGKTTVVVKEDRISSDVAEINKAVGN